jgi:hypothetical protein
MGSEFFFPYLIIYNFTIQQHEKLLEVCTALKSILENIAFPNATNYQDFIFSTMITLQVQVQVHSRLISSQKD